MNHDSNVRILRYKDHMGTDNSTRRTPSPCGEVLQYSTKQYSAIVPTTGNTRPCNRESVAPITYKTVAEAFLAVAAELFSCRSGGR